MGLGKKELITCLIDCSQGTDPADVIKSVL